MKNPNLKIDYSGMQPVAYLAIATDDLWIPACRFHTKEEAEFCIATCKLLKANGKDTSDIVKLLPYMLRMMNIKSNWAE